METERHRKERDAAGVNGDVKKDSRTRFDEDIDLDLAEKADNIAVDHERLKREMSKLFGADSLKVCKYIQLAPTEMVHDVFAYNPDF